MSSELTAVVLVPLWLLYLAISRYFRPTDPPPRARFVICDDVFRMKFVSPQTGDETSFECMVADIAELRKNQYSKGPWVHVRGRMMHTFMEDFDDSTVEAAASHVWPLILKRQNQGVLPETEPGDHSDAG